jgi:hypothetical protein
MVMTDEQPEPIQETDEYKELRAKLERIKWLTDEKRYCLRNPWVSSREQSI